MVIVGSAHLANFITAAFLLCLFSVLFFTLLRPKLLLFAARGMYQLVVLEEGYFFVFGSTDIYFYFYNM